MTKVTVDQKLNQRVAKSIVSRLFFIPSVRLPRYKNAQPTVFAFSGAGNFILKGCSACHRRADNVLLSAPNGNRYCRNCFEHRFRECEECHTRVWQDDLHHYHGDDLCDTCYSERVPIQEYSFTPQLQFAKKPWENTLYLGVELEVECPEDEEENIASDLIKFMKDKKVNDKYYLKYDGSLNNGFEIVTHPHTLQCAKDMKYYEILQWLKDANCTSYDSGRCGMHVHISKEGLTAQAQKKLRAFFVYAQENLKIISKRKGNFGYCHFETPGDLKYSGQDGRYWAVNFNTHNDRATVEIRIFRGTLLHWRFIGNLQFCQAVAE